jgi:hypothetical protein
LILSKYVKNDENDKETTKMFSANQHARRALTVLTLVGAQAFIAAAASAVTIDFQMKSVGSSSYTTDVVITNDTSSTISGWAVSFKLGNTIKSFYSADSMSGSDPYTFTTAASKFNGTIAAGKTQSFGFTGNGTFDSSKLANCSINGQACTFLVGGKPVGGGTSSSSSSSVQSSSSSSKASSSSSSSSSVSSSSSSSSSSVQSSSSSSKASSSSSSTSSSGLNPNAPPGTNFNLSGYILQLPTGSSGNIDTVTGAQLAAGYTKSPYFYTDSSDGAMVMADPATGWTTSGSLHPRVELRENAIWPTTGTNILNATVAVMKVPSHTTIGQIFQGTGPSKPLCELEVTSAGVVQLLLESTNQGGSSTMNQIASVSLGTKFSYSMQLSGTTITIKVGSTTKTFTMPSSFDGESFYFKAGDYDQSAVSGTPAATPSTIVKFYALSISH